MPRVEQINSLLQQEFASAISQDVPLRGGLITVMRVDCTPDLREADVFVSVLPEKFSGTVLESLRKKTGQLVQSVGRRVRLKRMPTIFWKLDTTEREAAQLETLFEQMSS